MAPSAEPSVIRRPAADAPTNRSARIGLIAALIATYLAFDAAFFTPKKLGRVVDALAFATPVSAKSNDALARIQDRGAELTDLHFARDLARMELGIYAVAVALPLILGLFCFLPGLGGIREQAPIVSALLIGFGASVGISLLLLSAARLDTGSALQFADGDLVVLRPSFWSIFRATALYIVPVLIGLGMVSVIAGLVGEKNPRAANNVLLFGVSALALMGTLLAPRMVRDVVNSTRVAFVYNEKLDRVPKFTIFGITKSPEEFRDSGETKKGYALELSTFQQDRIARSLLARPWDDQKRPPTPEEQNAFAKQAEELLKQKKVEAFYIPLYDVLNDKLRTAWSAYYTSNPAAEGGTIEELLALRLNGTDQPLTNLLRFALLLNVIVIIIGALAGIYAVSSAHLGMREIEKSGGKEAGDGPAVFGVMFGLLSIVTTGIMVFALMVWPLLARLFPESLRLVPTL